MTFELFCPVMKISDPLNLRLLTHNIRYATARPFRGEEKWEICRPYLLNELRFNTRHCHETFICLQEVLHSQLVDIMSGLNENEPNAWAYIGVGRDDGHEAGEYSPILYKPGTWELTTWKTIWLSETPSRPSKGWDAASSRILTVGSFTHHRTRKAIVAMNTHLDDQGSNSRREAAKLILHEISSLTAPLDDEPVFLAGDFNSEPAMVSQPQVLF